MTCQPTRGCDRAPGSCAECERVRAVPELIAEALGRRRNAMAIRQDLVDGHGFAARYASVRRFVVARYLPKPEGNPSLCGSVSKIEPENRATLTFEY